MRWTNGSKLLLILICGSFFETRVIADHKFCDRTDQHQLGHVKFADEGGPATLALTCEHEKVYLICCMTGFTTIKWYQFDTSTGSWQDFDLGGKQDRRSYEKGQTVSIEDPTVKDAGKYRCVGRGQSPDDSISNDVRLVIYQCADFEHKPIAIYPKKNTTVVEGVPGSPAKVTCEGFFGRVDDRNCGAGQCDIGFYRQLLKYDPDSSGPIEVIDDNETERLHVAVTRESNDTVLRATLLINILEKQDLEYRYVCWMSNDFGFGEKRLITFNTPAEPSIGLCSWLLTAGAASAAAVILVVSAVVFSCRTNIRLYWIEKSRTPPGDVQYDVALLAAENDDFGHYFRRTLSKDYNGYRPFKVYHYYASCDAGKDRKNEFFDAAQSSRCVLVVLNRTLLEHKDCIFCLNNVISRTTVKFILYDIDLSKDLHLLQNLNEDVKTVLRYRNRSIPWPKIPDRLVDPERGSSESSSARQLCCQEKEFWKLVRIAVLTVDFPSSCAVTVNEAEQNLLTSDSNSRPTSWSHQISEDSGLSESLSLNSQNIL